MKKQRYARFALLFLGLLGLLDSVFVLALGSSLNTATLLPAIVGLACLIIALLWPFIRRGASTQPGKGLFRLVSLLLGLGLLLVLVLEGMILFSAFPAPVQDCDCLIVLGAGVKGEQLSLTLAQRMHQAKDFLKQHPQSLVMVSGGQGPGEAITEAEAMRRYLLEAGIEARRIRKESQATSTFENLKFSKTLLAQAPHPFPDRIAILSSNFHLFRIKMLAKRLGLNVQTVAAPTPWYLLPKGFDQNKFPKFVLGRSP